MFQNKSHSRSKGFNEDLVGEVTYVGGSKFKLSSRFPFLETRMIFIKTNSL